MDPRETAFQNGIDAYNSGDYDSAVKWLRMAADQGHPRAQLQLGYCFDRGYGVAQDYAEAVKWYRKSADQGNMVAQYNLGNCNRFGWGVSQDYAEAVRWYRKSANQGYASAQLCLGYCYEEGYSVEPNSAEAVRWYRMAAEQGDAQAQFNLANCYRDGLGVQQDYDEALRWYRLAVDQGFVNAQTSLGLMYENGYGVKQDFSEAVRWYRMAAENGEVWGMFDLGLCYEHERGVERNLDEALRWYRAAVETDPTHERARQKVEELEAKLKTVPSPSENTPSAERDFSDSGDENLEAALAELESLVGLEAAKTKVRRMVNRMKVNQARRAQGMAVPETTNHLVFTGNPGTGKTTVARILAKIYRYLDVVSKGQLIETDYSGLVAEYIGQTAAKTKRVVEEALGGVLFIDEAYALAGEGRGGYGMEAIETLLKMMEDNRNDLVVIAAGYEDKMREFIKSNPGLESRFQNFIRFEDYDADELLAIFELMCSKNGYVLTADARSSLAHRFENMVANKDESFANGREARKYFDWVTEAQADRLCRRYGSLDNVSRDTLMSIIEEDVLSLDERDQ